MLVHLFQEWCTGLDRVPPESISGFNLQNLRKINNTHSSPLLTNSFINHPIRYAHRWFFVYI